MRIKSLSFLPSYNLIIVGQGLLKDLYEELIEKYNLKERVKIFGWTDDISSFLNSASILVCPSRHEPFGNIIIDGWAHKIPVIAANVSGPSSLIKEKVNMASLDLKYYNLSMHISSFGIPQNLRKIMLRTK